MGQGPVGAADLATHRCIDGPGARRCSSFWRRIRRLFAATCTYNFLDPSHVGCWITFLPKKKKKVYPSKLIPPPCEAERYLLIFSRETRSRCHVPARLKMWGVGYDAVSQEFISVSRGVCISQICSRDGCLCDKGPICTTTGVSILIFQVEV